MLFALVCCTSSILSWLDGLRSISGWIPFIGADPLFGEILEGASEYGVDIPTSERQEDFLILMRMISSGYRYALLCTIAGIISYAVYLKGIFARNQAVLWGSFAIMGIAVIFNCRFAVAGFIHLVNFSTSGIFNPYTGDMSGSVLLPFFTWVAVAVVGKGFFSQYPVINRYIRYCSDKDNQYQNSKNQTQCQSVQSESSKIEPTVRAEAYVAKKSVPFTTYIEKNKIVLGVIAVVILIVVVLASNGNLSSSSKPSNVEETPYIENVNDASTSPNAITPSDNSDYNSIDYDSPNTEHSENSEYQEDNETIDPSEESESYDYSEFEIY